MLENYDIDLIHCFEPKTNFLGLDALSVPVKEVCKPSIEVGFNNMVTCKNISIRMAKEPSA
ncbi:hypothetical protein CW713_02235, partial [Methanophagales archaeon]